MASIGQVSLARQRAGSLKKFQEDCLRGTDNDMETPDDDTDESRMPASERRK